MLVHKPFPTDIESGAIRVAFRSRQRPTVRTRGNVYRIVLGMATEPFTMSVRTRKHLGRAERLATGYRRSPSGAALVDGSRRRAG